MIKSSQIKRRASVFAYRSTLPLQGLKVSMHHTLVFNLFNLLREKGGMIKLFSPMHVHFGDN